MLYKTSNEISLWKFKRMVWLNTTKTAVTAHLQYFLMGRWGFLSLILHQTQVNISLCETNPPPFSLIQNTDNLLGLQISYIWTLFKVQFREISLYNKLNEYYFYFFTFDLNNKTIDSKIHLSTLRSFHLYLNHKLYKTRHLCVHATLKF